MKTVRYASIEHYSLFSGGTKLPATIHRLRGVQYVLTIGVRLVWKVDKRSVLLLSVRYHRPESLTIRPYHQGQTRWDP